MRRRRWGARIVHILGAAHRGGAQRVELVLQPSEATAAELGGDAARLQHPNMLLEFTHPPLLPRPLAVLGGGRRRCRRRRADRAAVAGAQLRAQPAELRGVSRHLLLVAPLLVGALGRELREPLRVRRRRARLGRRGRPRGGGAAPAGCSSARPKPPRRSSSWATRRCDCSRSCARSLMNALSFDEYDALSSETRASSSAAAPPGPPTGPGPSAIAAIRTGRCVLGGVVRGREGVARGLAVVARGLRRIMSFVHGSSAAAPINVAPRQVAPRSRDHIRPRHPTSRGKKGEKS